MIIAETLQYFFVGDIAFRKSQINGKIVYEKKHIKEFEWVNIYECIYNSMLNHKVNKHKETTKK